MGLDGSVGGSTALFGAGFTTVLLLVAGGFLLKFADNWSANTKLAQALPEGQTMRVNKAGADWETSPLAL